MRVWRAVRAGALVGGANHDVFIPPKYGGWRPTRGIPWGAKRGDEERGRTRVPNLARGHSPFREVVEDGEEVAAVGLVYGLHVAAAAVSEGPRGGLDLRVWRARVRGDSGGVSGGTRY
jgi:hypothetical protein